MHPHPTTTLEAPLLFKVQVNFYIAIFEDQLDEDVIDKWLNMLEGYFLFIIFPTQKIFLLLFSNPPAMFRTGGKAIVSRRMKLCSHYFQSHLLGIHCGTPLKSSTTLFGAMRINT